jgi:multidrug resistance protein, MATE family
MEITGTLQRGISYKEIAKTLLPLFIALSIPNISFIANNYFYAQIGEGEMGEGLICGVYFLLFTAIGYGLNNGVQTILSRRAGENNVTGIKQNLYNAIVVNIAIGILAIIFTWFIAPFILTYFMGNTAKTNHIVYFLRIRIISLPLLLCIQLCGAFLIATNKAAYIIIITLVETVINIFFDYTFIFGHYGFKPMGFYGAAYASLLADVLGFIAAIVILLVFKFHKNYALFRRQKIESAIIRNIFKQSAPLVFQNFLSIGSWLFFFFLISNYGQRESAISSIMRNMFAVCGTLLWACGNTTNTLVSNIIGQGKQYLVWKLIRRMLFISFSWSLIVCILMNMFPHVLIDIFDKTGTLYNDALPVYKVISVVIIFISVSTVLLNASTGTGNPAFNLKVEIFAIVCYLIYSYLSAKVYHWSLPYLWMNEFVYWTAIIIVILPFLLSGKWKHATV